MKLVNKLFVSTVLVAGAFSSVGCFRQGSNFITHSWITPEAGNYIVIYDVIGRNRGKVTNIANGTTNYSDRDQDTYELSNRVQNVVFTSENQGEGGAEDTSIKIGAGAIKGRANMTIQYQLDPTKESMGRFIELYKSTLEQFNSTQLRSALQICATNVSRKLEPIEVQEKMPEPVSNCLKDYFKKLGLRLNILSVAFNDQPDFGQAYAQARAKILNTQAEISAIELEKQKAKAQEELARLISGQQFERNLTERKLDLMEKAINKGLNPFPVSVDGNTSLPLNK